MRDPEIQAAWHGFVSCSECAIRDLVLFADLTSADFASIHTPIQDLWLPPGTVLYRAGEPADALYTIREGLLKLEQALSNGTQRIVSLLGQGQVGGLEATVTPVYEHTAIALLPTKVCRIPAEIVIRLAPQLHRQLMRKWNEALSRANACTRELATGSARQRVARLFVMLAPPGVGRVRLFGREDIGSLLGITTETASRVVADFKKTGVVREISLNLFERDAARLAEIAHDG